MIKVIGALGGVGIGLLVIFAYLVGERYESKEEIRAASTQIQEGILESDRKMAMSKYYMALDFGNEAEAEYYKAEAEEIKVQIEAIALKKAEEEKRLEEIRKETEQFYKDTQEAAKQANDNLEEDEDFYANLKRKNANLDGE
jgi:Zn-dependent metalloprotease